MIILSMSILSVIPEELLIATFDFLVELNIIQFIRISDRVIRVAFRYKPDISGLRYKTNEIYLEVNHFMLNITKC